MSCFTSDLAASEELDKIKKIIIKLTGEKIH